MVSETLGLRGGSVDFDAEEFETLLEASSLSLAQAPSVDQVVAVRALAGPPADADARPTMASAVVAATTTDRMFGRDREWAEIVTALAESRTSRLATLIIEGSRGQGRTLMLRQLGALARSEGYAVVERHGWRPMAEGLTLDIRAIADTKRPVAVLWDDPPWKHSDRIGSLAEAIAETSFFWALTRNTDSEPLPNHSLGSGTPDIIYVELCPLSEDVVATIVTELLGRRLSPELRALLAVAGGVPGRLHELVAGLLDEGLIDVGRPVAQLSAYRLPARLRTTLRHALADLSPAAHHLVQIAAVLGRLTFRDLAAVLDSNPIALMPTVMEAISANLLHNDNDDLVFSHDLVRSLVAESIPRALSQPIREAAARLIGQQQRQVQSAALSKLTPAELVVARLVRDGLTNRQVAFRLHVSGHTVNYHLRSIYAKLSVNGRVELARLNWPSRHEMTKEA